MRIQTKHFLLIISPLFFAVITLLLTLNVDSTVIIALASSVLHECGHLFALIHLKCEIKSVTLSFYGMKIIRKNEMRLNFSQELFVCAAGVSVNFLLSLIIFASSLVFNEQFLKKTAAVNLLLGLFNSLPVYSLDGGHMLMYLLKNRYDLVKSERTVRAVSLAVIVPLFLSGIGLFYFYGNFTLLICCTYLLASSFFMT